MSASWECTPHIVVNVDRCRQDSVILCHASFIRPTEGGASFCSRKELLKAQVELARPPMCSVPHAPTSSVRCWLTEVENEIPPWEARCLKISRGVMMSTSSRSVISPEVKGHGAVRDSSICRSCDDSSALKSQVIVRRSLDVLNRASATGFLLHSVRVRSPTLSTPAGRSKPFRNLITDRDRAEPSVSLPHSF